MGHENEITVTVNRGADPVLVTGDPRVVAAVVDALVAVLDPRDRRRVLALARDDAAEGAE